MKSQKKITRKIFALSANFFFIASQFSGMPLFAEPLTAKQTEELRLVVEASPQFIANVPQTANVPSGSLVPESPLSKIETVVEIKPALASTSKVVVTESAVSIGQGTSVKLYSDGSYEMTYQGKTYSSNNGEVTLVDEKSGSTRLKLSFAQGELQKIDVISQTGFLAATIQMEKVNGETRVQRVKAFYPSGSGGTDYTIDFDYTNQTALSRVMDMYEVRKYFLQSNADFASIIRFKGGLQHPIAAIWQLGRGLPKWLNYKNTAASDGSRFFVAVSGTNVEGCAFGWDAPCFTSTLDSQKQFSFSILQSVGQPKVYLGKVSAAGMVTLKLQSPVVAEYSIAIGTETSVKLFSDGSYELYHMGKTFKSDVHGVIKTSDGGIFKINFDLDQKPVSFTFDKTVTFGNQVWKYSSEASLETDGKGGYQVSRYSWSRERADLGLVVKGFEFDFNKRYSKKIDNWQALPGQAYVYESFYATDLDSLKTQVKVGADLYDIGHIDDQRISCAQDCFSLQYGPGEELQEVIYTPNLQGDYPFYSVLKVGALDFGFDSMLKVAASGGQALAVFKGMLKDDRLVNLGTVNSQFVTLTANDGAKINFPQGLNQTNQGSVSQLSFWGSATYMSQGYLTQTDDQGRVTLTLDQKDGTKKTYLVKIDDQGQVSLELQNPSPTIEALRDQAAQVQIEYATKLENLNITSAELSAAHTAAAQKLGLVLAQAKALGYKALEVRAALAIDAIGKAAVVTAAWIESRDSNGEILYSKSVAAVTAQLAELRDWIATVKQNLLLNAHTAFLMDDNRFLNGLMKIEDGMEEIAVSVEYAHLSDPFRHLGDGTTVDQVKALLVTFQADWQTLRTKAVSWNLTSLVTELDTMTAQFISSINEQIKNHGG